MNVLFIDFIKWNENNANFGDFYRIVTFAHQSTKLQQLFSKRFQ